MDSTDEPRTDTGEQDKRKWLKCLHCDEPHLAEVVTYRGRTAIRAGIGLIVPKERQSFLIFCEKCGGSREFRGLPT